LQSYRKILSEQATLAVFCSAWVERYTKLLQSVLHYNKELPPFVIPPSIISRVARYAPSLRWQTGWKIGLNILII